MKKSGVVGNSGKTFIFEKNGTFAKILPHLSNDDDNNDNDNDDNKDNNDDNSNDHIKNNITSYKSQTKSYKQYKNYIVINV